MPRWLEDQLPSPISSKASGKVLPPRQKARGPGRTPLAPAREPLGLHEAASPSLCFCTHLVSLFPFSRRSFSPL